MHYPVDYNIIVLQPVPTHYLCFPSALRPSSVPLAHGAVNLSSSLPPFLCFSGKQYNSAGRPLHYRYRARSCQGCRFDVIPLRFRRRRRVAVLSQAAHDRVQVHGTTITRRWRFALLMTKGQITRYCGVVPSKSPFQIGKTPYARACRFC